jgi:hypothetical protein
MRWCLAAVLAGALVLAACAPGSDGRPADDDEVPVGNGEDSSGDVPGKVSTPESNPASDPSVVTEPEPALEPITLATVTYSGIVDQLALVIRDATEWHERWADIVSGQQPKPDPPAVDFNRDMVLLIALGERPSGGYIVEIAEVVLRDGTLLVMSLEQIPERRCAVTRGITSPFVAATLPRTDAPIVFEHRTVVYECPDSDGG